jgi:CheY-like chemotaxis protein
MKIPVVVLTFPKEDPDIQECYDLEVNDCVAEPIQFDEFHKAVYALGLYRMKVNQPP